MQVPLNMKMSRACRRFRLETAVSALVVSANRETLSFLRQVFRDANWFLLQAESIADAVQAAAQHRLDLVITERALPDGGWSRLMELLKTKRPASQPQLIVTARLADAYLWAEVLNEGGYDVLAQPFDREEVVRVISAATRRSHNQSQAAVQTGSPRILTAGA